MSSILIPHRGHAYVRESVTINKFRFFLYPFKIFAGNYPSRNRGALMIKNLHSY